MAKRAGGRKELWRQDDCTHGLVSFFTEEQAVAALAQIGRAWRHKNLGRRSYRKHGAKSLRTHRATPAASSSTASSRPCGQRTMIAEGVIVTAVKPPLTMRTGSIRLTSALISRRLHGVAPPVEARPPPLVSFRPSSPGFLHLVYTHSHPDARGSFVTSRLKRIPLASTTTSPSCARGTLAILEYIPIARYNGLSGGDFPPPTPPHASPSCAPPRALLLARSAPAPSFTPSTARPRSPMPSPGSSEEDSFK